MSTQDQRFQVVTLHLDDGRVVSMLAPVFAETGDQLGSVTRISVSQPQELPEGYELTKLGIEQNQGE